MSLYKDLANAPDPKLSLTMIEEEQLRSDAKISNQLKLENEKLRKELNEFRKEFLEIKNQEVTVRNQEEQIRQFKTKMNEMVAKQLEEKESKLKEEVYRKLDKSNELNEELKRQLNNAKHDLLEAQDNTTILQKNLFELKSRYDKDIAALKAEVDLMTNENERLSLSYQDLKTKYSNTQPSVIAENSINWEEIAQNDLEITKLRETVHTLKEKEEKQTKEFKQTISRLTNERDQLEQTIQSLKSQLDKFPDLEHVSKLENKVKVLEALVGTTIKEEETNGQSVETVLRNKNRQLTNEIIQLKGEITTLSSQSLVSENKLLLLQQDIDQKQSMLSKWESDFDQLRQVTEGVHSFSDSTYPSSNNPNHVDESGILQMIWDQRDRFKAKILELENMNRTYEQRSKAFELQVKSLKNDNIKLYEKIKYLQTYGTGQLAPENGDAKVDVENRYKEMYEERDRFKAKILELENMNRTYEQRSKAFELQVKSLKNDNIKLYEKIKYLQTYGTGQLAPENGDAKVDVENRYKEMYEETVNPFVVFNRKVKNDRYNNLNPAEKLILSTTKLFLATKQTRIFLFLYMVCLHLLVFSTLWRLVHV
uniref:CASP C-terminal domain-containing protein n=1 Tax=Arcella intermedia TaxID=1963864 RepID=A0A6B2L017_9EUKA